MLGELDRQLTWSDIDARLMHYRTRDGAEVDGILEAFDGRIIGVEVKAASTVTRDDFRHLLHLRNRVGQAFHRGVMLYTAAEVLSFGDRLLAAPIDCLWRTASSTTS